MINMKHAGAALCSIGLGIMMSFPTPAENFIQCDTYVNVHSDSYLQSSIVGYMYNDNLIEEIYEEKEGWIKIKSGNVEGWINQSFVIEQQPSEKGYTVAKIHPDSLTVYAAPDSSSTPYTTVYADQEVECIEYKNDWLTLAFEDGSYGFIDAYQAELKTYYSMGETIEETNPPQENQIYDNYDYTEDYEYIAEVDEQYYDPGYDYNYDYSYSYDSNYDYVENNEVYEDYSEPTVSTGTPVETYAVPVEENSSPAPAESNSDIVDYASQFVGNPYSYGGNSLTDGIDCSHFVYQVLTNTGHYNGGYATSDGWVNLGSSVSSLDDAVAGDVVVYPGHVGIYDGSGGLIEAQGSATGITSGRSADHGTILAIRHFE